MEATEQLLLFIAQRIFLSKREAVIQEKTLIPWVKDDQQISSQEGLVFL